MFKNVKHELSRFLFNVPGWRTNRKIMVIESDDWGSIRMPSKEVYYKCMKSGYRVDLNPYERYDSLGSKEDLEFLFDLLYTSTDKYGNHPIITSNCVVANPDFIKIKADNFKNYYYELITETFKNYPNHSKNFELWMDGKNNGVFYPQFHAREHLNVSLFMRSLQNNDPDTHFGFENRMPGCIKRSTVRSGNYYVEATNFDSKKDKEDKLNIFLEGLDIFKNLFGYNSLSIIPPNYTWSDNYNDAIKLKGVKFIQGVRKMRVPMPDGIPKYQHRVLGKVNEQGQISLIRNCTFEPTLISDNDPVGSCLKDISIAFHMNKPAIISSHRINFIGHIDPQNRDKNLYYLRELIKSALKIWPDIEFMTTEKLGNLIADTNNLQC